MLSGGRGHILWVLGTLGGSTPPNIYLQGNKMKRNNLEVQLPTSSGGSSHHPCICHPATKILHHIQPTLTHFGAGGVHQKTGQERVWPPGFTVQGEPNWPQLQNKQLQNLYFSESTSGRMLLCLSQPCLANSLDT